MVNVVKHMLMLANGALAAHAYACMRMKPVLACPCCSASQLPMLPLVPKGLALAMKSDPIRLSQPYMPYHACHVWCAYSSTSLSVNTWL